MESTQLTHSKYWGKAPEEIVKDYFKQIRIGTYIVVTMLVVWCLLYMLAVPESGNFLLDILSF